MDLGAGNLLCALSFVLLRATKGCRCHQGYDSAFRQISAIKVKTYTFALKNLLLTAKYLLFFIILPHNL